LRPLIDVDTLDAPITAGVHVSMYGKLNETIRLWPGNLPPLLAQMSAAGEFEDESDENFFCDEVEIYAKHADFHAPRERLRLGESGVEVCADPADEQDHPEEVYLSADTLERPRATQA
jgi:hypothetical protein